MKDFFKIYVEYFLDKNDLIGIKMSLSDLNLRDRTSRNVASAKLEL